MNTVVEQERSEMKHPTSIFLRLAKMTTTRIAALLLALTLTPHFTSAANPQPGTKNNEQRKFAKRPNVLFIVSDDHGWGDLQSNWDKTEVRLPTLEALAAKGVRFPNYHTVPLCGPSRACMFTGQYSTENGMWRGPGKTPLGSPGYRGIKRDVKMLSEHLSKAGYRTGAFGKWHLGALAGKSRTTAGLMSFTGFSQVHIRIGSSPAGRRSCTIARRTQAVKDTRLSCSRNGPRRSFARTKTPRSSATSPTTPCTVRCARTNQTGLRARGLGE